ncbi:vomeronasal type-2 receptor 26-like [Leptodactylus fuscus]|uniref:vomeronasal type-2 receptor 26-like n=1 Tax=Leptodactylus fuscus TaxID=238119 RepID=UPI003F4F1887
MELQAHASINVDGTGNVLGESKFPKVVALLGGISLPDVTTYYKANLLTRWFTLIVPPQDPMVREMAALQHGELLDKHLWTPDLTTLRDPHFDPLLKRTMPNLASPDKRLTDLLVNKERLDKDALQTLIGNKQISFLHYQHFRHSIASLPRPVTTDEPMSKFKRMVVLKSPRNRRLANSKAALLDTIPDSKPGYLSAWEAELGTQSPQRKLNPTKVGGPTNPTNPTKFPVSRCSEPCLPGSRKKTRPTIHICCYDCAPCSEGEISNVTDADSCSKCQSDEWPNEKRDRCLPKVMEFISYHNDTIASVSSSISLFGCLVTGSIFRIFISYRDTPIVKANNRNLSYLLLVSIILSFLSVFLFLGRPSDVTCRLRETSFGVFFSVAVSSLLAKTVMVCVAFKSTKPGSPWRKWLSVKLPYTIVLLCSSFQVVICILWLSISPPFQDLDTQSYPEKIIIQCNEGSDLWFYSMLGYMGLLAAVSFLLAFMVRTLPDSFNEAKYITFSMLLFCSVWMAMIPAYLSTRGKYMVAVEIFAVMASSAGLLACVFFPKCFIILFRSEMNRKTDLLGRRKEICNNSNK